MRCLDPTYASNIWAEQEEEFDFTWIIGLGKIDDSPRSSYGNRDYNNEQFKTSRYENYI